MNGGMNDVPTNPPTTRKKKVVLLTYPMILAIFLNIFGLKFMG